MRTTISSRCGHPNRRRRVHHTRPAANPLFISAAKVYGERVIGIILSGGGRDGADGLRAIKEHGGTALVQQPQQPQDALTPSMPLSAIAAVHRLYMDAAFVLP
jgi:two-component system, chemotaxis family, protein-glutamate methylesterase/glutaminase